METTRSKTAALSEVAWSDKNSAFVAGEDTLVEVEAAAAEVVFAVELEAADGIDSLADVPVELQLGNLALYILIFRNHNKSFANDSPLA